MKKQIFTLIIIAAAATTSPLLAQQETTRESSKTMASDDWHTGKVIATLTDCDIVFSHVIKAPRDAASGQATGKRQHKPYSFTVSSTDNSVTETNSPTDQSGAQSAGKVSYSDLSVMISMEKASVDGKMSSKKLEVEDGTFTLPADFVNGDCDVMLAWKWADGKRCTKTFTVTAQDGTLMAINEKGSSSTKH